MKKMITFGLIGLGLLILAHQWYTTGVPFEVKDTLHHEFFACLFMALGLGGLLLG